MSEVTTRVRRTRDQVDALLDDGRTRDLALLVARVALAWIFVYHGASTLFGAFSGPGIARSATFYAGVAHLHPGTFFAVLGGSIEFFGGIAVGVGVFGRIAAALLVGDMVMAMITVTFANGIVSTAAGSGYEINLALAALALVVACMGTGRFSLDRAWRARSGDRPPHGDRTPEAASPPSAEVSSI